MCAGIKSWFIVCGRFLSSVCPIFFALGPSHDTIRSGTRAHCADLSSPSAHRLRAESLPHARACAAAPLSRPPSASPLPHLDARALPSPQLACASPGSERSGPRANHPPARATLRSGQLPCHTLFLGQVEFVQQVDEVKHIEGSAVENMEVGGCTP